MEINPGMPICNSNTPVNPDGTYGTGTIGGILFYNNNPVLLTCYHCVNFGNLPWPVYVTDPANENVSTVVDGKLVTIGKIIAARRDDRIDAAIIQPNVGINPTNNCPGLNPPGDKVIFTDSNIGAPLMKYGAKTKLTKGKFIGVIPSVGGMYAGEEPNRHFFTNLLTAGKNLIADPSFSEKGDSGAFILDQNNSVAGVLCLGQDTQSYLMNPMFIESRMFVKFKK
jgi:hypothetical protein